MRILIADDNQRLADSLAALLQSRGAETQVVYDGDAACAALDRGRFDVLLVDLKLPGRSGVEVVRHEGTQGVRVLAMTGYDTEENIRLARSAGAEDVLLKPFSLPALFDALDLDEAAPPQGYDFARVAVCGLEDARLEVLEAVCGVTRFGDPEALRRAVAEARWDAAVVGHDSPDCDELVEDLGLLDEDLVVVRSADPGRVTDAIQRTGDRRARSEAFAELQDLFDATQVPLLMAQGDPPAIARWNRRAAAFLGFRPRELEGTVLGDLDSTEVASDGLHGLASRALASGETERGRACVRTLAEGERLVSVVAYPVGNRGGVALQLVEERDAGGHEEALRLIGATSAGVAHEMRNTLGGVAGSLGVLAGRLEPDSAAADILAQTRERVARASAVMGDLLDFSRPVTLRLQAVPVKLLLDSAADEIRQSPGAEDLDVSVEVPDASLRLLVDAVRLRMALIDLGRNAVQALRGSGRITFASARRGPWVELSVADDGPGVPEGVADRVFEPFFTTRAGGSGLGLANVRKLAEAHGGSIAVDPDAPGARFVLRLPTEPRGSAS